MGRPRKYFQKVGGICLEMCYGASPPKAHGAARVVPTLRKMREGWGTLGRERLEPRTFQGVGHPPESKDPYSQSGLISYSL